jgi:hypothetical protein
MKKSIIYSALIIAILLQTTNIFAGNSHGHKRYAKHNKHHKTHKVHRPHGIIDATYQ